jgi:hypothetical protein
MSLTISTDISIDEYHASEFISHSKLRTLAEVGPFGYRARHLTGENKRERTDAMAFGQAFETFSQEPQAFARRYVEAPAVEGKADDALLAEAAVLGVLVDGKPYTKRHDAKTVQLAMMRAQGQDVMTRADMMRIERMAESFARNPDAQDVCRGMQTQATLREDFGGFGVLPGLQSRPDWYGDRVFPDLKTCGQFGQFDREILTRGYHTQAALIDIIVGERCAHPMIVVESEWPYRCQVVDLPLDLLEAGREWCEARLAELRECYARDNWPLCETRREANVPRWMKGIER